MPPPSDLGPDPRPADQPTRIQVGGESLYDVVVGTGLLGHLPELIGTEATRVAVVHPAALRATADAVRDDLAAQGYEAHAVEVPDAEDAKTAEVCCFFPRSPRTSFYFSLKIAT